MHTRAKFYLNPVIAHLKKGSYGREMIKRNHLYINEWSPATPDDITVKLSKKYLDYG